ncbi:MAG: protein phosphatase 2C domain-containing protein [Armatimonadota bacterium]|nr:protein phosphatase 2C domain-containing protein [Armatimonadota bacterium]
MSEFETTAEFDAEDLAAAAVQLRVLPSVWLGAKTDIGRLRENNEDKYEFRMPDTDQLLASRGLTFVVCDGMGGAEAGQIASELATKTFLDVYYNHRSADPAEAALDAARAANRYVNDVSKTVPGRHGMGCTLTALAFVQDEAVLAHVGDSRAYRLRDGVFEQVSDEHTYVEEQVRLGMMTVQDAEHSQYKHILSRAVGAEPDVAPQIDRWPLMEGDTYVLCSDGVSNELSDDGIKAIVEQHGPSEAAWRIVNEALLAGGRDNATVIVVVVMGLIPR